MSTIEPAIQTHALNKSVLCLQLQREWSNLSRLDAIHQLGKPFGPQDSTLNSNPTPPRSFSSRFLLRPSNATLRSSLQSDTNSSSSQKLSRASSPARSNSTSELPILRFLFQSLASHFPGLDRAPPECWASIQAVFDDFNSRNFSTSRERQELTKRLSISVCYTRILATYLSSIVCFADANPEPSRLDLELLKLIDDLPVSQGVSSQVQSDLDQIQHRSKWVEVGESVRTAKAGYQAFIHRLINDDDELDRAFKLVATYDKLELIGKEDEIYGHSERWASLWLAYVIHFVYISGPDSEELRALVIKVDGLIPYELMKQGLKIVNPTLAIKSVVTLMLGQPFGGLSLFQRILKIVLKNQIGMYEKDIETILASEEEEGAVLRLAFETLKDYVYISGQEKRDLWAEFENKDTDIVIAILTRDSTRLSVTQIDSFKLWLTEFTKQQSTPGSSRYENCGKLLRNSLLVLKRDREQLLEMVLEPNNHIIRTIKLFLEIYYPTMYELAAASDLSRRVTDTEAFVKDLIRLFHRTDRPVEVSDMIDLIDTHKQSYWRFVHEIVSYKDLCTPLKEWFRRLLGLIKNGSRSKTDPASNSVPKLRALLTDMCQSASELDAVQAEAASIASYDLSVKALAEVQYRTEILGSARCNGGKGGWIPPQEYKQAVLELARAKTVKKTGVEAVLGWAWWLCEEKLMGRKVERQASHLFETAQYENGTELSIARPQLMAIPRLLYNYVKLVWN
ncbi:hypothetical protein CROQUDRAFT_92123 [Cronartium quercuum f. sp. fusiforme G11]|uniref:Uncharacterized protein n=1 Tax=Cronartium quercuum f. sp. fusiforme G11 TaxID=708437 RepID=A0A9P6NH14_9BASI|nr:hypothetical protein CROQUDRAFT_92123 [Cronartium quercuum f. sp. fusiforme G11]